MKILIAGPQGSGKTTQARILAEKLDLCLIKTGDLTRARAEKDDELGRKLKAALDLGILADDSIIASLLKEEMAKQNCPNGFVTDGYPRRLHQLEVYDPEFDQVFYLDVPNEVVVKRMLDRGREDDTPELIEERLKIFHEETAQVMDYYEKLGKLVRVDGSKGIEEVSEEIMKEVNSNL